MVTTLSRWRRGSRHGVLWLLCLALLLPLAQSAAARHTLSHGLTHGQSDGQTQGLGHGHLQAHADGGAGGPAHDGPGHAPPGAHCDLCLLGSAVGGGALPVSLPALPPPVARHARPVLDAPAGHAAPLALAYRSRAPPSLSR